MALLSAVLLVVSTLQNLQKHLLLMSLLNARWCVHLLIGLSLSKTRCWRLVEVLAYLASIWDHGMFAVLSLRKMVVSWLYLVSRHSTSRSKILTSFETASTWRRSPTVATLLRWTSWRPLCVLSVRVPLMMSWESISRRKVCWWWLDSFTVCSSHSFTNLHSILFIFAIDGKISFADLLDVMHTHSVKEKIPQEILDAFVATDWARSGQMMTRDLKHILCDWGEKLNSRQFEQLLREANIAGPYFKYEDFVKIISAPIPDYWSLYIRRNEFPLNWKP